MKANQGTTMRSFFKIRLLFAALATATIALMNIPCQAATGGTAFYFRGGTFSFQVTSNRYHDGDAVMNSGPSVVQFYSSTSYKLVASVSVSRSDFGEATQTYSASLPAGSYLCVPISAEMNVTANSSVATDIDGITGLPTDVAPDAITKVTVRIVPPATAQQTGGGYTIVGN